MRRFRPGETVVRREILHGEVWFGCPHICVADTGDLLATYVAPGAPFGFPATGRFPNGRHPWQAAGLSGWAGHGMLALHWAGVDHAVFVYWAGAERRFASWYFNLQDAPRRTPIGFDTLDHELDLVWPASEPTWHWKDEDKFAVTGPVRYPGRVAEIRAEGERIAKLLDSGQRWWDQAWADWVPDPDWTVPALPRGWAELPPTTR